MITTDWNLEVERDLCKLPIMMQERLRKHISYIIEAAYHKGLVEGEEPWKSMYFSTLTPGVCYAI